MATNKNKTQTIFYIILTIVGCILACSSIIPNDYIKLVIVMGALCFGIYGIMKSLSHPSTNEQE